MRAIVFRLFPPHGLDNSLLTAVLLGLYVRLFFTESFGWVFSGLVVPGYLASVVVVRPASAAVIAVEAALTWVVVRGLARALSATRLGTPMFGRDRFIWIVLASVAVRVAVEGVAGPAIEAALRARGVDLAGAFGFYGVGLVLVPLAANACWKPGLPRGAFQLAVTTALTLALLRLALVVTNLSLASMALSFEHIALDFGASPKAYLLILAGALLASRANLRWGWDTNGVLIPGLLCLGWFNPLRLAATLLEAIVVAGATFGALKLPRLRDWNVEGPRRVVFVFTVGYLIKLAFVWLVQVPGYGAHELFGIGYLLPSLLAVKVWQKRNPAVVLLPAVQLSLAGLVVGSAVGLALVRVAPAEATAATAAVAPGCAAELAVESALVLARARVARHPPSPRAPRVTTAELEELAQSVAALAAERRRAPLSCATLPPPLLDRLARLGLRPADARTQKGRHFIAVVEATDDPQALRGFGLLLLASSPGSGPTLVLARPQHDLTDATAMAPLVDATAADAVVVGGVGRAAQGRGDPERDADVPLRVLVAATGGRSLTVHGGAARRSTVGRRVDGAVVGALRALLPDVDRASLAHWNDELQLSALDEQRLTAAVTPQQQRFRGWSDWLAAARATTAPGAAPPRIGALLLAEEVVAPLVDAPPGGEAPTAVRNAAAAVGVALATLDEPRATIAWGPGPPVASGAVVISSTDAAAPLVEMAHGPPGAVELAATLADTLHAGALVLDGHAHAPLSAVARSVLLLHRHEAPAVVLRSTDDAARSLVVDDTSGAAPASELASRVVAALGTLGIAAQPTGRYQEDDDGRAPADLALLRARGTPFVDVVADPATLTRFRALHLGDVDRQLLARYGIATAHDPLGALLGSGCPAAAEAPLAVANDLRLFAETHHPGALDRAVAAARRGRWKLSLAFAGRFAEPWVVAQRTGGATAVALVPQAAGETRLPCDENLADAVAHALAARRGVIGVEARR